VKSATNQSSVVEQLSGLFSFSELLFGIGLALETFEVVRPLGVLIADYFFLGSLLFLACSPKRRLLKSTGSGVLSAAAVILCGGLLSAAFTSSSASATTAAYVRIVLLFGLFAPLAVAHSKNIRANMSFLVAGVAINCIVSMLSAWVSPDIVSALSVNPQVDTYAGQGAGRFAGLGGHPNTLGLSTALAVLVGIGLFLDEKKTHVRWILVLQILICTVGALLTGSRTFIVSLAPGLVVLAFSRGLNRGRALRVCVCLIGLFVSWRGVEYFAPDLIQNYTARLDAANSSDIEDSARLLTAGMALAEISQKPIVGWGVEHFGEAGMVYLPEDKDFMPAHVSFLHYWYAEGIVGGIGFLMLFVLPSRRMVQSLKANPSGNLANTLRLGLSVYLLLFIASNLNPIVFNRFLYMPLFIFAGLVATFPAAIAVPTVSRHAALLA
jgi:O-Antigen ligase